MSFNFTFSYSAKSSGLQRLDSMTRRMFFLIKFKREKNRASVRKWLFIAAITKAITRTNSLRRPFMTFFNAWVVSTGSLLQETRNSKTFHDVLLLDFIPTHHWLFSYTSTFLTIHSVHVVKSCHQLQSVKDILEILEGLN